MRITPNNAEALNLIFDRSERMFTEAGLNEWKDRFSRCFVFPNQMLYLISYNPRKVIYSRNVRYFFKISDNDFGFDDTLDTIFPDDREFITSAIGTVYEWPHHHPDLGLEIIYILEYRILNREKKMFYVQCIWRALEMDRNRYPVIAMCLVTDVTPMQRGFFIPKLAITNPRSQEQYYFKSKEFEMDTPLSRREIEVLKFLCKGYSSKEIAERLFISKHTVDGHRRTLLEKTGLSGTAELVSFAQKHQLVDF